MKSIYLEIWINRFHLTIGIGAVWGFTSLELWGTNYGDRIVLIGPYSKVQVSWEQ